MGIDGMDEETEVSGVLRDVGASLAENGQCTAMPALELDARVW
jgi:hypothetical protein